MKNGPPPVEKKEEVGMDSMTGEGFPQMGHLRRDEMKTPDDVAAMVRLKQLGWAQSGSLRSSVVPATR
jgi:hypothetical protein